MTEDERSERLADEEDLAAGYPSLADILRTMQEDEDLPDVGVRHLEVHTFASGDATYNYWVVGAEEREGGYISP